VAQRIQIAIDCHDAVRLADFWAEVLGYVIEGGHEPWAEHSRSAATYPGEAWVRVVDPDKQGPRLLFHSVSERKTIKNRIHMDIRAPLDTPGDRRQQVADFRDKIVSLGGTKLRETVDENGSFAVMADPEGNEFCTG